MQLACCRHSGGVQQDCGSFDSVSFRSQLRAPYHEQHVQRETDKLCIDNNHDNHPGADACSSSNADTSAITSVVSCARPLRSNGSMRHGYGITCGALGCPCRLGSAHSRVWWDHHAPRQALRTQSDVMWDHMAWIVLAREPRRCGTTPAHQRSRGRLACIAGISALARVVGPPRGAAGTAHELRCRGGITWHGSCSRKPRRCGITPAPQRLRGRNHGIVQT